MENNELLIMHEPLYKKLWRPALAWAYVAICIFDFLIAPTIMMAFFGQAQATTMLPPGLLIDDYIEILKVMPAPIYHAWDPLTLKAGGFFHITMGAVIGVGSWTRGKEKAIRATNNVHSD